MNNQSEPIDVTSTAVAVRDNQPAPLTKFDAHARKDALETILNRQALVLQVMKEVMREGVHYGKIPGCGDKPALYKAGAEKLAMVFRLTPMFAIKQIDHDKGNREYEVVCTLSDGSQGVGTCSTLESKYRFRGSAKKLTDKPVPSGYWDLRKTDPAKAQAMLGGKGFGTAKNESGVWMITEPTEDKVENDNPADVYNTVLKMAKKRAQVDATLTATGTSDLLTQDIEEMVEAANAASSENSGTAPVADKTTDTPRKEKTSAPRAKKEEKKSQPESKLPNAEAKRLFKWLDVCQAAFVVKMEDDGVMLPFAWAWAVKCGLILPNETLSAVQATKLFPGVNLNANVEANKQAVADDFRKNVIAIETMGKDGPLDAETMKGYRTVYKEPADPGTPEEKEPEKPVEVPRDRDVSWKAIAVPAWSKHFKEGAKTFGDLKKNQLWWWVIKWQPEGFNGKPPKDEDIKLRKILDTVKEQYDFESDDAGSEPASRAPDPEPAPVQDDDIPF